jgi:rhodanese-related sulfurtransferase
MRKLVLAVLPVFIGFSVQAYALTPDSVPEKKRSTLGLYLTADEAFKVMNNEQATTLFIDVRSRAEVNFLGMPQIADANVPYMEMDMFYGWDEKKNVYKMELSSNFVPEIEKRLAEKGLSGKDSKIVLMCRSGDRSAAAANFLGKSGFTKVYSIVDGYEGDVAAEGPFKGQRAVNGWRNNKLPWSYTLDKKKLVIQ